MTHEQIKNILESNGFKNVVNNECNSFRYYELYIDDWKLKIEICKDCYGSKNSYLYSFLIFDNNGYDIVEDAYTSNQVDLDKICNEYINKMKQLILDNKKEKI
jgi:hypothetical protein